MQKKTNIIISTIVIIAVFIVGSFLLMLSLLPKFSPYLQERKPQIERWIGDFLGKTVTVGSIEADHHGFEPVLKLHDLAIIDTTTNKPTIKAQELQIGVDLFGSLINWRLVPGFLFIKKTNVVFCQTADNALAVVGMENGAFDCHAASAGGSLRVLSWLFTRGEVDLEDSNISVQLSGGDILKFSVLKMELINRIFHHRFNLSGILQQENNKPAKFDVALKLYGSILRYDSFAVSGRISLQNGYLDVSKNIFLTMLPGTGKIRLYLDDPIIVDKDLWASSLLLDSVSGVVEWQHQNDKLQLDVTRFKLWNDNLTVGGDIKLQSSLDFANPYIDTNLDFTLRNAAKLKNYSPIAIMPKPLAAWLNTAFVSGSADGKIILQGNMQNFPFTANNGKFEITSNFYGVGLNYDSAWPILKNANGRLNFIGKSMHAEIDNADLHDDLPIFSVPADIADLTHAFLTINDDFMVVNAERMLHFFKDSPLRTDVARNLGDINISGLVHMNLKLGVPLADVAKPFKFSGALSFTGDNFVASWKKVLLEKLRGVIHFANDKFEADALTGKILNRPVKITVHTLYPGASNSVTQITTQSAIMTDDLEKIFGIPVSPYVAGETRCKIDLRLFKDPAQPSVFLLKSDLKGLKIALPSFLGKSAEKARDFSLQISSPRENKLNALVSYADLAQAKLNFLRDVKGWRFAGGDINLDSKPGFVAEDGGLMITGNVDKLDLKDWQDLLSQTQADISGKLLKQVVLNVNTLVAFGYTIKSAKIFAAPLSDGQFLVKISSPTVVGKIFLPRNLKAGVIKCAFSKLHLSSSSGATDKMHPKNISRIVFSADDVVYGDKQLGRVGFTAHSQHNDALINDFEIVNKNFNFSANGKWSETDRGQVSVLVGKVTGANFGDVLKQWQITPNLDGGKGVITFALNWAGAFYDMSLKKMAGNISLKIGKGRIINLSQGTSTGLGIGRILNLLSLQNISTGIIPSFRQGFVVDSLSGDLQIKNGSVFTKNTKLEGPLAAVEIRDRIGFSNQDYDLTMIVTPKVTSSLPVIATLTGGPVVGATTLLANTILGAVVQKVVSYKYHVTGSWAQPKFTKI